MSQNRTQPLLRGLTITLRVAYRPESDLSVPIRFRQPAVGGNNNLGQSNRNRSWQEPNGRQYMSQNDPDPHPTLNLSPQARFYYQVPFGYTFISVSSA